MKRSEIDPSDPPSNKRTKTAPQEVESDSIAIPLDTPNIISDTADVVLSEHKLEREHLVGITKFSNPKLSVIHGVIKARFSDFQVNEVDVERNTVKLTHLDTQTADEQESIAAANPGNTAIQFDSLTCDQLLDQLKLIIPENIISELESLNSISSENKSILIPPIKDKETRKNIHFLIKRIYPNLATNAKDNEITVQHSEHVSFDLTRSVGWPKKLPTFCQCVLFKENIDTLQAISSLAYKLNTKVNNIGYAGIKDKRAKTSQLITFRRIKAKRLVGLNKGKSQIKLGNFSYVDKQLKLGDLTGNKFRIVIRNVSSKMSEIAPSIDSLKTNGFVNYFGIQRFGNIGGETHEIGKLILQHKLHEAVNMIVGGQRRNEDERTAEAREIWRSTHDAKKTLEKMPRIRSHETTLLRAIDKHEQCNNWHNVLQHLPLQTRKLYVHAYQSYLWNKAVSARLDSEERLLRIGDCIMNSDGTVTTMDEDTLITEKYSIEDLVMPTLGDESLSDINNQQLLQDENIQLDVIKSISIEYQLRTIYRKVFIKPDIKYWSLENYTSLEQSLISSDLDEIEGIKSGDSGGNVGDSINIKTALLITFFLPKGCYATMALRELLREDTSSTYQASLNAI